MTVSSIVVRAVAVWTGVETEFPTGIQVLDKSQLAVSLVPDQGQHQALTLGLHYSVTLSSAGIATVAPLGAFPVTPGTVSFVRQTPMTQTYDPTATDTYDAAGHAAALDRSAMRVAELSRKVDDIEASSIVVAGGAASVPEGAVYVSNGEGGAVAGPTSTEIETARAQAVSAAGAATGAAGVATDAATMAGNAAALADQLANAAPDTPVGTGFSARHWATVAQALSETFNLAAYLTTAQITAMLQGFVPAARKLKAGAGLSIDGNAGSHEEPVEADFSADRLLSLISLSLEVWTTGTDTTTAAISPAQLAAAITALAGGAAPKRIMELSASGNYTPSAGTKFILAILRGGGGGGGNKQSGTDGSGGGEGGIGFAFVPVVAGTPYACVVGAGGAATGGGGTTNISITGVTFSATGGAAGASGNYSAPGAGGVPSSQCLFGQQGASGANTSGGTSLWRVAGSAADGKGGNGGAQAGVSSASGSAGSAGHITILEFGS